MPPRNADFIGIREKHVGATPRRFRNHFQIRAAPAFHARVGDKLLQVLRILLRVPKVFFDSDGDGFHIHVGLAHVAILAPRRKGERENHDSQRKQDKQLHTRHPTFSWRRKASKNLPHQHPHFSLTVPTSGRSMLYFFIFLYKLLRSTAKTSAVCRMFQSFSSSAC